MIDEKPADMLKHVGVLELGNKASHAWVWWGRGIDVRNLVLSLALFIVVFFFPHLGVPGMKPPTESGGFGALFDRGDGSASSIAGVRINIVFG